MTSEATGATLADLGRYLVDSCIRPRPGERVLVRWYQGQRGLFEGIADGIHRSGASVDRVERGSEWLRTCTSEQLGDDWLPGPEAPYDRVVTSAPPEDVHRPDGIDAMTWNEGHRKGYENLARRVTATIPTVLVDWPLAGRGGHSRGRVRRFYAQSMAVDYGALEARNAELIDRLEGGGDVDVRCPHGTALRLSVEGRPWRPESCNHDDGPVVYLPGGEVYSACIENSAEGIIVFNDGSNRGRAYVESGRLVRVENSEWQELVGLSVGEIGIGTNPRAPREQLGSVTEKAIDTLHFGVGSNDFLGGETNEGLHIDLVVDDPEVRVNGRLVDISIFE